MDVTLAMYACAKMDAILPTIINNINLLFNFFIFETSLDISPELFISIVRFLDIVMKASCIVYLISLTHVLWIIVMDGEGFTSKTKTITVSQLLGLPYLPTCF